MFIERVVVTRNIIITSYLIHYPCANSAQRALHKIARCVFDAGSWFRDGQINSILLFCCFTGSVSTDSSATIS